jgi:hypothetical protein
LTVAEGSSSGSPRRIRRIPSLGPSLHRQLRYSAICWRRRVHPKGCFGLGLAAHTARAYRRQIPLLSGVACANVTLAHEFSDHQPPIL